MSDDGYTLAEALAALAILGLAIGGLGLVVSLIARQQLTAVRLHDHLADARAADRILSDLTAGQDLRDLAGDAEGLSFACAQAATCAVRLQSAGRRTLLILQGRQGGARRLRLRDHGLRFSYLGADGAADAWPQAVRPGEPAPPLRAIILRAAAGPPLSVIHVWPREPRDCRYDTISGACRAVAR